MENHPNIGMVSCEGLTVALVVLYLMGSDI